MLFFPSLFIRADSSGESLSKHLGDGKNFPICKPRSGTFPARLKKCHKLSVLKSNIKTKKATGSSMNCVKSLLFIRTSQAPPRERRNSLFFCFHCIHTFISLRSHVLTLSCEFEKLGVLFFFLRS